MKLNKILLTTCALPIAVTPAISITSCNRQQTTTFEIDSQGLVTLVDKSLTSVKIPATINNIEVHGIATNGFKDTKVESVTFEKDDQITRIGDYAFKDCTSLKAFLVPKNVTYLGIAAFSGCTSLETFNFEHGIKIQTLRERTFENTNLYEIDIPGTVMTIEKNIFAYSGTSRLTKTRFATKDGWKYGSIEIPTSDMEPDNCSKNLKNFNQEGPNNWGYTGMERTAKEATVSYSDKTITDTFVIGDKPTESITEKEATISFKIKTKKDSDAGDYLVWINNASGYSLKETIYKIDMNNWVLCTFVIDNWTYVDNGSQLIIKIMKKR